MSDLAFSEGEGGAVHLLRPLQCHSNVDMACIDNVAWKDPILMGAGVDGTQQIHASVKLFLTSTSRW